MSNNPQIRHTFRLLIALALVCFCVFSSLTVVERSFAVAPPQADPIAQADSAIVNAAGAFRRAEDKGRRAQELLAEMRRSIKLEEPDNSSATKVRRLIQTVSLMFDDTADPKSLPKQLFAAQKDLSTALADLETAKTKLEAAPPDTPNLAAAKNRVGTAIAGVKTVVDTPKYNGLAAQLNEALSDVYSQVEKVAAKADKRLEPFERNTTDQNQLYDEFQADFVNVPTIMQFDLDLQNDWPKLSEQLKNVVENHDAKVGPANTKVKELHDSVKTIAGKIDAQLGTLSQFAQDWQKALKGNKTTFLGNPSVHEKDAIANINSSQAASETLQIFNRTVDSIAELAKAGNIAEFNPEKTKAAQKNLTDAVEEVLRLAAEFQGVLAGDRQLWITEKIKLYYFTDIPRLVKTLNPEATLKGGNSAARQLADNFLEKLRNAEDAQSAANGAVSSLKRRVTILRQQLEQADAEARAATTVAEETARRDEELKRRTSGVSEEEKARSAETRKDSEDRRVAAQERADKLNDEKNGLVVQLRAAETQLDIAQANYEAAANETIRAAQRESTAFAQARDNAPFWYAPAVITDSDPARRVEITSSTGGENAIFVRGRREDVNRVQDLVANLDEPTPQARMTLWKIELNSDATKKGAEKFNEALEIVEKELADTRGKIADTLSQLLGAVSKRADIAAQSNRQFFRKDCHEKALYGKSFPASNASSIVGTINDGLSPGSTDITGRNQRLKRYSLYSPQVLKELGIGFIDELGFDNPKQFGLKDPGAATTLNEALIILLLTDRPNRDEIIAEFEKNVTAKLGKKVKEGKDKDKEGNDLDFRRLKSMLDISPTPAQVTEQTKVETTRQQQELIYAMRGPLLRHLVGRIARLQTRVDEFRELEERANGNGTGWAAQPLSSEENELRQCLKDKFPVIFDTIHDEFPISPVDIMEGRVRLIDSGEGTIGLQAMRGARPYGLPKVYNLRPSPARVAAADGMLDVFTKAFEDDIDRNFVQPMLKSLREKLHKTGIGFGVIQRTSVLATNRLVARVDPRATAELSVGETTNIIQGLQSIAQIALAAQQGNILGGIDALGASAKPDNAAEIYGITSGSAFQVTPIFDPTGQALRFKFDFVDATLVREPRGTTNPRLPRVERHSVNTEVQLANMEIREVSRFETNAKIGLPTTYWGGLPLLKDLPGVRPIPLIGWFVRRKGSNAIAQRSLIFAQTTMSPTIGDILDLFDTSLQRR